MTSEIKTLNDWLELKAKESENYWNNISGSNNNWCGYLRDLKNIHLKSTIEICQTMFSYNPNPLLDYVRNHKNEYDILPSVGYWVTGSSTIYVKKPLTILGSMI